MITLGIIMFIVSGVAQVVTLSHLDNDEIWCKGNLVLMAAWLGLFIMGIAGLSLLV